MDERDREREQGQPDPTHDTWSAWLPQLGSPTSAGVQDTDETHSAVPQVPPAPVPPAPLPPSAWAPPRQPYAVRFPAALPPTVQRPRSWMGLALLCLLVCFPIGIVAVVKAASVNTHWVLGRVDAAHRASRSARNWCIAALVVWMCSWFFLGSVAHVIYAFH